MNKYLVIGIAALVLTALGGFLIKQYGYSEYRRGKAEAAAKSNEAVVKDNMKRNGIEYELRTLDNVKLVSRYCRWVRDIPYDECVRTYNFIK